ncbi:NADH-FMN oxidoreductase RutF, flavin reductase (DIM6/NTAB) family [Roseomonas rosea]|uniref:NADH-FMN oxidoreductase RutF, flavin reductase (DIM6/NTAB) family n=1 Tax=Muricoccus roseus TaxID=198092 RepID=A0A1M6FKX7_9PROT|nr:flavin reductase family protein [Roseomonas rosea]SHI98324.1 NADH-FMN oxidoreductase RutF, flavin reductase (DIM6/NTAB) family [Roseomonas rosea]
MAAAADTTEAPFDPRALRHALGQFATGVAIVTAPGAEAPVGMTISSFNSVSLDPPLVLFSVARSAHSLPALLDAPGYAIHVLGREQEETSGRFARALAGKWQGIGHRPGLHDAPLLDGALAHFECAAHARHDGGDHVIFLARVLRFSLRDAGEPLIFFRGRYRALSPTA